VLSLSFQDACGGQHQMALSRWQTLGQQLLLQCRLHRRKQTFPLPNRICHSIRRRLLASSHLTLQQQQRTTKQQRQEQSRLRPERSFA
jgi:hypothetical protein